MSSIEPAKSSRPCIATMSKSILTLVVLKRGLQHLLHQVPAAPSCLSLQCSATLMLHLLLSNTRRASTKGTYHSSKADQVPRTILGLGGRYVSCFSLNLVAHRDAQGHQHEFPVIARMAKDFLAIPGASVSVEHLFSKSHHLCSDLRASLAAKSVTEVMCARQWLHNGLYKPY